MSSTNPVVRFPNLLNGVDRLLLDIVFFAYHDNRLPTRFRFIRADMPASYRPESESLDDAFTALKEVKDLKTLGDIPGVTATKDLLREIATGYFYRAIGCCQRLKEWLVSDAGKDPKTLANLNDVTDWRHFLSDLTLLRTILDSRHPYIGTAVLSRYLLGLEGIQIAIGHSNEIESMCRKLRAITRPKPRHAARPYPTAQRVEQPVAAIKPAVVPVVEATAQETPGVIEIDEATAAKDAEDLRDLLNPVDPTAGETGA
jgi:hypothetical protein